MVLRWLEACLGSGLHVWVSGTDCQGKEKAGEEQNPRDMAANAQMHIKRKENKPSMYIKDTVGKVHKRTELPGLRSTPLQL